MKVLFTGGSGLLGKKMQTIAPEFLYPRHQEFDVTNLEQVLAFVRFSGVDVIIHAAAATSPPKVDKYPAEAVGTNIIGTANIVQACFATGAVVRLIYISTDYVFDGSHGPYKEEDPMLPVNKYAWTKLGGECAVNCYGNSLIIRTSFGADEFPYPKAFSDQWTSRVPVAEFAEMLMKLVNKPDLRGIIHVGSRKSRTVYEYAKDISPTKEIHPLLRSEVQFAVPRDTSLDTSKFWKLTT